MSLAKKWLPFGIFEFFAKITKHKNACISKTVPDRAISVKFLTHRESVRTSLSKFQWIFHLPNKWRSFWIFKFFAKIIKHKNYCISKTVPDRETLAKVLTHRVSMKTSLSQFQRIFHLPEKWRPFWIFEFFSKMQNTKMLVSRKLC